MKNVSHRFLMLTVVSTLLGSASWEQSAAQTQSSSRAQSPSSPDGTWIGTVINVKLVFHFKADASGGWTATMDSPQQGAMGLPIASVTLTKDSIVCVLSAPPAKYAAGRTNDSTLTGTWYQGGSGFPLVLHRQTAEAAAAAAAAYSSQAGNKAFASAVRPQTPHPPYPYKSDSVEYDNADKTVHLGATLTYPKTGGPFPAAILITGSGTQDRDETIFGHHPFAVIADYLTRRGYAVLRVDDRGAGLSTGDVMKATSADFAKDVETSMDWLKRQKEINPSQIGLIGHSEGAAIAPMLASRRKDVAFIISLAGPANGYETLMYQSVEALKRSGASHEYIQFTTSQERLLLRNMMRSTDTSSFLQGIDSDYRAYLATIPDSLKPRYSFVPKPEKFRAGLETQAVTLIIPWWKFLINYRAANYYPLVKCPVLALGGGDDIQVADAMDLPRIDSMLEASGNKRVTTHLMPGLNHLFQHCHTCMIAEYGTLDETFSPEVLQIMGDWLDANVKK